MKNISFSITTPQFVDGSKDVTRRWGWYTAKAGDRLRGSGKMVKRWGNQTDSGQNKLPPSPTRAADRSLTYLGLARAMAQQWGAE